LLVAEGTHYSTRCCTVFYWMSGREEWSNPFAVVGFLPFA